MNGAQRLAHNINPSCLAIDDATPTIRDRLQRCRLVEVSPPPMCV